ncbi:RTase [Symbiodinium sp. CCMP2592]|nr:RTase [Symbiodinium sp. CCMP2592]
MAARDRVGHFLAFQTAYAHVINPVNRRDPRTPLQICADVCDQQPEDIWILAPTDRPLFLMEKTRRVRSLLAVVVKEQHPREQSTLIFLDLRGVGMWVQWLCLESPLFDPMPYLDSLQLEYHPGWSVVIRGGRRTGNGLELEVQRGELLSVELRLTEDITPTESENEESNDEGQESDSESGGDEDMPDAGEGHDTGGSDDGLDRQPDAEPDPDRSRSPRRTEATPEGGEDRRRHRPSTGRAYAAPLLLAALVTPPEFDLTRETMRLPHSREEIGALLAPWPPDWIVTTTSGLTIPKETAAAFADLQHWSDLLDEKEEPHFEVHMYTDGSYLEKSQLSGYGAVILLLNGAKKALFGLLGEPIIGDLTTSWQFDAPPVMQAEQAAIAAVLLWLCQSRHVIQLTAATVYFDNMSAGWGASGKWSTSNSFGARLRQLAMFVDLLLPCGVRFRHTKAHQGDPWNEMADAVAKAAARGDFGPAGPPKVCASTFFTMDMSWLAAATPGTLASSLPIWNGQTLTWTVEEQARPSPLTPEQLVPTVPVWPGRQQDHFSFRVRAATLNVQGMLQKHAYLEAQFQEAGYQIILLQETKEKGGFCRSANYWRVGSDAKSHWGTAIWIHRHLGPFTRDGKPCMVAEEDMHIVHSDERLLVLSIKIANFHCVAASGHCPHSGRPKERHEFLRRLHKVLAPLAKANLLLVGIDLNGRPPESYEQVTGDLVFGEPDEAGKHAVQMLDELGMWIPATFSAYHSGPCATYRHPLGHLHRIDFLCIGGSATCSEVSSAVNYDLDTAGAHEDHFLSQVAFVGKCGPVGGAAKLWRPKYDRLKMATDEGKAILEQELAKYCPPPWTLHVDQHCQHLQNFLHEVMDTHFAVNPHGPRASYIPAWVWELRERKISFKRRTEGRRHMLRHQVRHAVDMWRDAARRHAATVHKDSLLYQLAAAAVGIATRRIKIGIREAKAEFLRTLAGTGKTASQILQRAKQAGVGGRRPGKAFKPIPKLLGPDGRPATTRTERDDVWLQHFGEMEMGTTMSVKDFLRECPCSPAVPIEATWQPHELPNLVEIEGLMRRTQAGKSPGLDAIPGELLRGAPIGAAKAVLPLFMKALVTFTQPLQWRGGILHSAWKQSGPIENPSNHRSLFVSSLLGKTLHRALRDKAQGCFGEVLHDIHFGMKKGAPVTFGAQYIASHMRYCKKAGISACTLFLDMRSAYYRVIRELATGDLTQDGNILRIFRRFDIDGEEARELLEAVASGGAIRDSGVSPAICAAVADFHRRTWFVSAQSSGDKLSATLAGSRPGESWADVLFGYVYSRVLCRVAEIATAEDLLTVHHYEEETGIYGQPHCGVEYEATDTTWAHDSAFPMSDRDPGALLRKAKRLGSLILSHCRSYGMDPNTRRGKTSYLISLQGAGVRKAKAAHFEPGGRDLYLPDLDIRIPVVPSYTHLGGVLDAGMTMKDETRRRLAIARGSFDAGKLLLYQNPTVPLEVRAKLFEAAILPTFFNLCVWEPRGDQWTRLCDGYSRLLRRLLQPQFGAKDVLRLSTPLVHALTRCWRLETEAIKARLGFLCSLVKVNPPHVWAVLQSEQTWLQAVRQDLQLVVQYAGDWPELGPSHWPQWWHLIKDSPGAFKARVKKALQRHHEKVAHGELVQLGLWAMFRRAVQNQPRLEWVEAPWYCRPCGQGFKSKAGMGAHMFKVHARKAQFRGCVSGTMCRACGKQYWSQARLAVHLRDSPTCVTVLRHHGLGACVIQPGFGSKAWKRRSDEEFCLALPEQVQAPLQPWSGGLWDDRQLVMYADLCYLLFERRRWDSRSSLRCEIEEVLCRFPLYRTEENDVLNYVSEEVAMLQRDDPCDPWDVGIGDLIIDVLTEIQELPHYVEKLPEDEVGETVSFREFASDNWKSLHRQLLKNRGTRAQPFVLLGPGWEAEKPAFSDGCQLSATITAVLASLPKEIQELWDLVLQGRVSEVQDVEQAVLANGKVFV